jgi:putative molybdopterin biosynthesis protein
VCSSDLVLLDEMLAEAGLSAQQVCGYDQCQPSHAAVAQAVASGQADVGLGPQSAAAAAGLGFVPLVEERYQLVCLKSALDTPAVDALRRLLASPVWQHALMQLPGYAPDNAGSVQAMSRWLPWWTFKP